RARLLETSARAPALPKPGAAGVAPDESLAVGVGHPRETSGSALASPFTKGLHVELRTSSSTLPWRREPGRPRRSRPRRSRLQRRRCRADEIGFVRPQHQRAIAFGQQTTQGHLYPLRVVWIPPEESPFGQD